MPLPFIGLAAVAGVRALVRSPRVRQAVARGISRAQLRRPKTRTIPRAARTSRALAPVAGTTRGALTRVGQPIRRVAPALGSAVVLGGAFQIGASAVGELVGGLHGNGVRTAPPGRSVSAPGTNGAPPAPRPPGPGPGRVRPPYSPIERRRTMPAPIPGRTQTQPLRGDVPIEFAEITVIKQWQTFPGGPVFTQFSNGKIAVRKKNGQLKVYRPARNIVVSRNPRVRTLLRADSRLDNLISKLRGVCNKKTSSTYKSKKKGVVSAKASASTR